MKTLRCAGIFKTFMRAECKESSDVTVDNTFSTRKAGPFDYLGVLICGKKVDTKFWSMNTCFWL